MTRHYRDSHTRKRMASAHAKHAAYCDCGKIVRGNGGQYQHAEMHRRKNDGHHAILRSQWEERFREDLDEGSAHEVRPQGLPVGGSSGCASPLRAGGKEEA